MTKVEAIDWTAYFILLLQISLNILASFFSRTTLGSDNVVIVNSVDRNSRRVKIGYRCRPN